MCATAWQFLVRRMDRIPTKPQIEKLKPTLVIRHSSDRLQGVLPPSLF
jgi:DNA-binding LacI/PurR family transcriptional regulator